MSTAENQESTKKRGLHVLTLTPFYPNEFDDGAGCFVAEPIRALSEAGIVNTVLALQPLYRKKLRIRETKATAEWLRYFALPGSFGLPTAGAFAFSRIVGRVRELNRQNSIDLIHAHAPLPAGHAAMLLSAELGLPYVVSVHGLDVFSSEQASGKASRWCSRISRTVYQKAKRVICISETVRQRVLEGMSSSSRTSVVYNGVDTELFSPAKASGQPGMMALSVGNLLPSKGHDVLIRAIGSIAAEFPQLTVELIGHGPEQPRLQELARELGIAERVHFLGRRSRHDVAEALRRCTLFALPSSYEGLGCVYLEAMATAKPAIGCRGQGIAEIIRQGVNGFLVGAGNDKELSLVLAMLLRDEGRHQSIGNAARDTVLDRLTLVQQAENLARIYRECAG